MVILKNIAKLMITQKYRIKNRDCKILSGAHVFGGTCLCGKNEISYGATVKHCNIGFASYVGSCSYFIDTKTGKFCSISSDVKIVLGRHPTKDFVSTHPAFFSANRAFSFTKKSRFNEFPVCESGYAVEIGNDVWIGKNAMILGGVTIGDGAIIGAGAVVTKNVAPYSIVAGVPAKEIRKRFTDDEIEWLINAKWWDKPVEWLTENCDAFSDINALKTRIGRVLQK